MIPGWTLILWMLGYYSSTAVRQQKSRDRRNRSSIFGLLDRPSPQIADMLTLSMSTPQRCMILDSLAAHHEDTCRQARQVCNDTYCTGSQCRRSRSNGVTMSYFRRLLTRFDAEFKTDCSMSSRHLGAHQ